MFSLQFISLIEPHIPQFFICLSLNLHFTKLIRAICNSSPVIRSYEKHVLIFSHAVAAYVKRWYLRPVPIYMKLFVCSIGNIISNTITFPLLFPGHFFCCYLGFFLPFLIFPVYTTYQPLFMKDQLHLYTSPLSIVIPDKFCFTCLSNFADDLQEHEIQIKPNTKYIIRIIIKQLSLLIIARSPDNPALRCFYAIIIP